MPIKSEHSDLLNELVDMQESPAYAARKSTLARAEQTIVRLEERVAELERPARERAEIFKAVEDLKDAWK